MKIVVSNGYSWQNKGDAALAMACFEAIRGWNPEAELGFVSLSPSLDRRQYQVKGLRIVGEDLEKIVDRSHPKALRAGWFAGQLATRGRFTDYRRLIADADIVVACPGGYLNDSWGPIVRIHLNQLAAAKARGIPFILSNQSIGPFHSPRIRQATGKVLRDAQAVISREEISQALVAELGVARSKNVLAPDLAFSLSAPPSPEHDAKAGALIAGADTPVIGVTVREWSFRSQPDPQAAQRAYMRAVTEAVETFVARTGGRVLLLPQVIGPGADDDRIASRRIFDALGERSRSHVDVVTEDLHPLALRRIMSRLDALVGTRMHSNIFALTEGTPVVAIGYEHKTLGIMRMMGQEPLYTDINTVTADQINSRLDACLETTQAGRTAIRDRAARLGTQARQALQGALTACVE